VAVSALHEDVQGNVLLGYRHMPCVAYLFCTIGQPPGARSLLAKMLDPPDGDRWLRVMNAEKWPSHDDVPSALNVALTYQGLERLGWSAPFTRFADFRAGMKARAIDHLGDSDENDPDKWQDDLAGETHMLLTLYCVERAVRDELLEKLRAEVAAAGMHETACQLAEVELDEHGKRTKREQFGFADGFSQPALETKGPAARGARSEGDLRWPWALGHWRPIRLGEFLLGHRDEDNCIAGDYGAASPHHNGTFMVWRKLEQDVDAFTEYFDEQAKVAGGRAGTDAAALKAKAIGRWKNGDSLALAPLAPLAHPKRHHKPSNAFDYSQDPAGASCPRGAHVRRANPRVGLGWGTVRTRRHRMIRRGVPYSEADGRGLVFVCFCASITRQFELVQRNWLLDGDLFGLGGEQDLLLGRGKERSGLTIDGDASRSARCLQPPGKQFVRTRGGYYLFVPGIAALRRFATSAPAPDDGRRPTLTVACGPLLGALLRLTGALKKRRFVSD
jgi:Dyp-type peroxidase family